MLLRAKFKKQVVMININNENLSLNQFITHEMFMSLSGCTVLVCSMVQILKGYINISPLFINLICSFFVTIIRMILKEDFTLKGILLGLMQIIPIMLSATGTYEFSQNILNSLGLN